MTERPSPGSEMRFVVGSAAGAREDSPENFDLSHEVNLVKAALLYADRVELVSAGASMLYGFVALGSVPPEDRLALVREHAPSNAGTRISDENLQIMDLAMGRGSPELRRAIGERRLAEVRKGLQAVTDAGWEEIKRDAEERFDSYNARGLGEAVDSGLLEIHTFGGNTVSGMLAMTQEGHTVEATIEDILREYVERASIAIDGPGYPLFEDLLGRLVDEAVREGLILPSLAAVHRGRHGELAGDLLGRLPLFEGATVDEVLDIRRALERHLRGFRSAVSGFSREIQSAAWEPGFAGEADVLFREKVEPEVEGIEEAVRENRSYAELGRRVLSSGGFVRASFGALLGGASELGALSGLALGIGVSGVQALVDQYNRTRELRGNQLYFYYGARELLRDREY